MRVLVAGCHGLLGQHLLGTAPAHARLYGLARHADARDARLSGYLRGDIADGAAWDEALRAFSPDLVLNAAALTDVDGCERDPDACARVNRDALRAPAASGIPLVHLSTDYVFDGAAGPYAEDDPVNPPNAYGRIKLESERIVLAGSPRNLVVRTMWVWGEGQGAKQSFPDFVRGRLAASGPVRAVTDQWGNPTRAADLAMAIWKLVECGCSGVYHAAGADRVTRFEWARRVAEAHGLDATRIEPVATDALGLPARRPLLSGLRCDKLMRDTGFAPRGL